MFDNRSNRVAFVVCFFLLAVNTLSAQEYKAVELWASPIDDYRDQAVKLNLPEFNSAITTLKTFEDRLWIGYGDGNRNLGTPLVIEFRCFADPDRPVFMRVPVQGQNHGAPQRTEFDTGEEQIEPFRVCVGMLCQVGVDSNDHDELWTQSQGTPKPIAGNFFRLARAKNGDWNWEKFRSVPGGEHVHDVAEFDGKLYAVGSGAAHRDEWGEGRVFRYIWQSDDRGESFKVAFREVCPELSKTDTRFRYLLAVDETLYAFGFVNPFVEKKPRQPKHVCLKNGQFSPLTVSENGKIAEQIVVRTWNLRRDLGLVIAREPEREDKTSAFLVKPTGFHELADWPSGRIIDGCPESETAWLFLVGDGKSPESFSIKRCDLSHPEKLSDVVELKSIQPNCLAVWCGYLFVGTRDGKIFRTNQ